MVQKTYDVAEEERADTSKKGPGKKCYWVIALLVGLGCLALVIALILSHGVHSDVVLAKASSQSMAFGGKLRAYPRLGDNPADVSEIVICEKSTKEISKSTESLLNEYKIGSKSNYKVCKPGQLMDRRTACLVDVEQLQNELGCTKKNNFGFSDPVQPCFFLRIETNQNWEPDNPDGNSSLVYTPEVTLVECSSKSKKKADIQRTGLIKISGAPPGFPNYYFPKSRFNSSFYRPPLVIVKFMDPETEVDISVECQIKAKNSHMLQFNGKVGIRFRILSNLSKSSETTTQQSPTTDVVQGKNPDPITGVGPPANESTTTEDPVQGKNPDPIPGVPLSPDSTTISPVTTTTPPATTTTSSAATTTSSAATTTSSATTTTTSDTTTTSSDTTTTSSDTTINSRIVTKSTPAPIPIKAKTETPVSDPGQTVPDTFDNITPAETPPPFEEVF